VALLEKVESQMLQRLKHQSYIH